MDSARRPAIIARLPGRTMTAWPFRSNSRPMNGRVARIISAWPMKNTQICPRCCSLPNSTMYAITPQSGIERMAQSADGSSAPRSKMLVSEIFRRALRSVAGGGSVDPPAFSNSVEVSVRLAETTSNATKSKVVMSRIAIIGVRDTAVITVNA
jgi:hypothetical protein